MGGLGDYERERYIGRGAHGTVYQYLKKPLPGSKVNAQRKRVVIKQIPVESMSASERQQALKEARLCKDTMHPFIIGYYDYFLEGPYLCIVMEYARGGSLADMLACRGSGLSQREVLPLLVQMSMALSTLHEQHILHRDLKPHNILLNKSRDVCKISDFGIAKELSSRSKATTLVGTPNYLSPEMCEGSAYNEKSDMWSLGCILYEMLTLNRAFDGESLPVLVRKITTGQYIGLEDDIGSDLRSICSEILSVDPQNRPTANQLLAHHLLIPVWCREILDRGAITKSGHMQSRNNTPRTSQKLRTGSLHKKRSTSVQSAPDSAVKPSVRHQVVIIDTDSQNNVTSLPTITSHMGITNVACSDYQKMALTGVGKAILWEEDDSLSFGGVVAIYVQSQDHPLINVLDISAGDMFSAVVTDRGILLTWGLGVEGCLGHDSTNDVVSPRIVETLVEHSVAKVACATSHVLALTHDNLLFAWGKAQGGCLGHDSTNDVVSPRIVETLVEHSVAKVACATSHVLALTHDNLLFAWGKAQGGRLGVAFDGIVTRPTLVNLPEGAGRILSIHCTVDASAILNHHGRIYATGNNRNNKLGIVGCNEMHKFVETEIPHVDFHLPQPFDLAIRHSAFISNSVAYIQGSCGPLIIPVPTHIQPQRIVCAEAATFLVGQDASVYCWDGVSMECDPIIILDPLQSHGRLLNSEVVCIKAASRFAMLSIKSEYSKQ